MGFKGMINNHAAPIVGLSRVSGNKIVNVNNRTLVSGLKSNFGDNSQNHRDKMSIKKLMIKSQQDDLDNNPLMARRLQQKLAKQMGKAYNFDYRKVSRNTSMTQSSNKITVQSQNTSTRELDLSGKSVEN